MNYDAEPLEMSLTKTVNYKLKPFGRFGFDWKDGKRSKRINVIYVNELDIKHNTGMPLSDEQDKLVLKEMKKHKTDIFIDAYGYFYTRVGVGWTEIGHIKLNKYRAFLTNQNLEDTDYAWAMYVTENEHLYYH
jgi:hypothetical protein